MRLPDKLIPVLVVCAVSASVGCADPADVVAPQRKVTSQAPAFDGIGWTGSGGRSDSTHATTTSSTDTPAGIGWTGSGS